MCACVCIHVCVYVCVYACMCVRMHVFHSNVAFKCCIQVYHLKVLELHVCIIQKCECVWKILHVECRLSVVIRLWVYGGEL